MPCLVKQFDLMQRTRCIVATSKIQGFLRFLALRLESNADVVHLSTALPARETGALVISKHLAPP